MNHKILEQIKGGGFLAGDLPMSTSSIYYVLYCNRNLSASRLLRITTGSELQLRIPAVSAWNIGLKLRVFALDMIFLQTNDRKTCFLGPKTRQLSKTPGNFRKRAGTSQNTRGTSQKHPELSKHTRGTSQPHPELPNHTRNFPKTPGTSSNVPGTSQNTRGTSEHPGNFPKTPG
jgi:hypothetical protein